MHTLQDDNPYLAT